MLQHANRLKKRGYDVALINLDIKSSPTIDWFPNNTPIYNWDWTKEDFPLSNVGIVVATHFSTAKIVENKIPQAKRRLYFIQSDERRFGLSAEDFLACEESYRMDIELMTEAKWIQRWLKEEFNQDAYYVPNGLDEKIFFPTRPIKPKSQKPRILLEGPIDVPFKGMDDAYSAVKNIDCELWIVSSAGKPKIGWRCDRFFEKVPMDKMRDIYSSCDIFLKMSKVEGFFGPPLEAMACGCVPVVAECTGFDEYIEHEENALTVAIGDIQGATEAVQRIIDNVSLREKLVDAGKKTAQEWSWERSVDFLEKVITKEPIEIFYTEESPRHYDFNKTMAFYQKEVIRNCNAEIKKLMEELAARQAFVDELKEEIAFMHSSKFWRLREWHEKMKFVIFHPVKFLNKYLINRQ